MNAKKDFLKTSVPEAFRRPQKALVEVKAQRIPELKSPRFQTTLNGFNGSKTQQRAHSTTFEKERLYDENIQLKRVSNGLMEENIRLRTRIQQTENEAKTNFEEPSTLRSRLIVSVKKKNKELKKRYEDLALEFNELRCSLKATRVNELEEEAKQYFNECWRLKKIIEDNHLNKGVKTNRADDQLQQRVKELNEVITKLTVENSDLKVKLMKRDNEIKLLKGSKKGTAGSRDFHGSVKESDISSESHDKSPVISFPYVA